MNTNRTFLIQPLRIALLCGSALMLSTAFAEDGSNLSGLRPQTVNNSTTERGYQTNNSRQIDINEDGTNLADLRPQLNSTAESGYQVNASGKVDINEDGTNLNDLSAQTAQESASEVGYLTDSTGQPVMNAAGECFHTGSWKRSMPPCAQPQKVKTVEEDLHSFVYNIDDAEFFGFNQATLSDQTKSELDQFVDEISMADLVGGITVTGHADKLGSTAYNRTLAFRRADAVKDYLVSKGISADLISTQSEGSSAPMVSCLGNESKTQMISCLSPNRRVDVDALLASHVDIKVIDYGNNQS